MQLMWKEAYRSGSDILPLPFMRKDGDRQMRAMQGSEREVLLPGMRFSRAVIKLGEEMRFWEKLP